MEIFLAILYLVIGFVFLIKGADLFVDGSSSVAKLLKVPSIIIGLTVVAFGTSMPEASVSISSAIAGANELAVSNVVGSNIFNLLVVLGASALIKPVCCQKNSVKKEIPFSILCTVALLGALFLGYNKATPAGDVSAAVVEHTYTLGWIAGLVLLALFAFYMYWQISDALKARKNGTAEEEVDEGKKISPLKSIIFIVIGIAGIILGGNLVVNGATTVAEVLGMDETLIGMTIVAVGTSLPELVTSMVAAKKGESDIALGNVIGSNIFNIIFILGFSCLVSPITVGMEAVIDTIFAILVTVIGLVFSATKLKFERWEGGVFIVTYVVYLAYMILRAYGMI
ncbi:MAG: calcium/sodium antiporter [Clostridia bacterium]|nr:calcium/sodium antiporter [Clostridia bacterium]